MSESPYGPTFEMLRAKWAKSGILAAGGAGQSQIAGFEKRYGVVLPEDIRAYFANINGTKVGRLGMDDDDLIGFWHLDQVRTFAEEDIADLADAARTFAFADQSICVYTYVVRLCGDATAPTPVIAAVGSSNVTVSPSFLDFIERYIRGDRSAIYPA
jgi:SMI1/KNR4 family protein SUKH-1